LDVKYSICFNIRGTYLWEYILQYQLLGELGVSVIVVGPIWCWIKLILILIGVELMFDLFGVIWIIVLFEYRGCLSIFMHWYMCLMVLTNKGEWCWNGVEECFYGHNSILVPHAFR
jgi:hypothetical protein